MLTYLKLIILALICKFKHNYTQNLVVVFLIPILPKLYCKVNCY